MSARLAGDFLWSLTYTHIATQWTEGRAVWNKGAAGVLAATRAVETALPFALLGYLHERKRPVAFTRSRPYHSDDMVPPPANTSSTRNGGWSVRLR